MNRNKLWMRPRNFYTGAIEFLQQMTSLKRIAIIIPGGLGTGRNNIGVPVLEQIVNLLSLQFDITIFQLFQVNEDYEARGFDLLGFKSGNKFLQYFRFFNSF